VHAQYDTQLEYIEFFLDALLTVSLRASSQLHACCDCDVSLLLPCVSFPLPRCQDPPEHGGRNFSLLFSLLDRLRQFEDVRDVNNIKLYKLGELALRALQKVSSSLKWAPTVYEAAATLSPSLFRRRTTPHPKGAYVADGYKPKITLHKKHTGAAAATSVSGAGSEPATPKRKRKSKAGGGGGGGSEAGSVSVAHEEEGSEEEHGGSAAKKQRTASGAKAARSGSGSAKKSKKELKPPASPTRGRLSRGAKECQCIKAVCLSMLALSACFSPTLLLIVFRLLLVVLCVFVQPSSTTWIANHPTWMKTKKIMRLHALRLPVVPAGAKPK
jgi:hypothetical protein